MRIPLRGQPNSRERSNGTIKVCVQTPAQALQMVKVSGSQMAGSQRTSEGHSPPNPEIILPSKDIKKKKEKTLCPFDLLLPPFYKKKGQNKV